MSRLMHNNKNGMFAMGIKYVLRRILTLLLAAQMTLVGAAETITYYHNDALGSPVAATDEAGNLLWREAYRPYGSRLLIEDGGTKDTWCTGKQEDTGTGLSYFGARWYDPNIGRFMAIDPVGFKESNIHSFNRYAYANNNPYKFVDPDGMESTGVGNTFDGDSFSGGMGENGLSLSRGTEHILVAIETADTISDIAMPLKGGTKMLIKQGFKGLTKDAKGLKPTLKQENPHNLIPTQTKSEMSGSQVKRLAKDMKQNGFDQNKPVDAWKNPQSGRLEIQDGHHRTEAAKKAGLNKIPVKVWE